jgi:hypothetical protein
MKRFKNLLILSLAFAGFLLVGAVAKADILTITLDAPYQIGPGPVFTFYGTITNTSTSTVYLNGDSFPVLDFLLTPDDSGFYNNTSSPLTAGQSTVDVELFTITAPGYALGASNLYSGTYEIQGGADSNANDALGSANFNVQVSPEPSSLLLLASGLAGLAGTLKRRLLS